MQDSRLNSIIFDEFINVCKASGRGRLQANFVVVSLSRSKRLTIPVIKTMITGVGDEISFLKVWKQSVRKSL